MRPVRKRRKDFWNFTVYNKKARTITGSGFYFDYTIKTINLNIEYRPDLFAFMILSTRIINRSNHQFLNWWPQHATGMLHLMSSNLGQNSKKDTHQKVCVFFLLCGHFRYRSSSLLPGRKDLIISNKSFAHLHIVFA